MPAPEKRTSVQVNGVDPVLSGGPPAQWPDHGPPTRTQRARQAGPRHGSLCRTTARSLCGIAARCRIAARARCGTAWLPAQDAGTAPGAGSVRTGCGNRYAPSAGTSASPCAGPQAKARISVPAGRDAGSDVDHGRESRFRRPNTRQLPAPGRQAHAAGRGPRSDRDHLGPGIPARAASRHRIGSAAAPFTPLPGSCPDPTVAVPQSWRPAPRGSGAGPGRLGPSGAPSRVASFAVPQSLRPVAPAISPGELRSRPAKPGRGSASFAISQSRDPARHSAPPLQSGRD